MYAIDLRFNGVFAHSAKRTVLVAFFFTMSKRPFVPLQPAVVKVEFELDDFEHAKEEEDEHAINVKTDHDEIVSEMQKMIELQKREKELTEKYKKDKEEIEREMKRITGKLRPAFKEVAVNENAPIRTMVPEGFEFVVSEKTPALPSITKPMITQLFGPAAWTELGEHRSSKRRNPLRVVSIRPVVIEEMQSDVTGFAEDAPPASKRAHMAKEIKMPSSQDADVFSF